MSSVLLKITVCCVLLAVAAANALLPAAAHGEFVCRADVSYSWKKEPEKGEKGEKTEADTEAKVEWSTAEGIGADEPAAKAKLAESSKRELRRALSACEERHNNLSRCIANKFASVSSLFSSISFTARRNLEQAIAADCAGEQGKCLPPQVGEAACSEIVTEKKPEEAQEPPPEAGAEKGGKAKADKKKK